jgi:acyl carrier protein
MVPAAVVELDALPLTPSGKLDRRALPEPEVDRDRLETGYVAPASPMESLVAGIWEEVLGQERVGAEDDFFALGGHSLLATQVVARMRRSLGVEVPVRALFEGPTVRDLARVVERARREDSAAPAEPPLAPMERPGPPPLSFAQERLWFLDRLEPGGSTYNVPTALHVDGDLSALSLWRALGELTRRPEVLRTRYEEIDGAPVQRIDDPSPPPLPVVDLGVLPEAARRRETRRLARSEARRPFDLERGPVLRATLVRLGDREHLAMVTLHHIASDGWSMGVVLHEVAALYAADLRGERARLPEPSVQYADFALWQRGWLAGEVLAGEVAYWRERLADVPPVLELPTDHPRPASPSHRGASRRVLLGPELTASLRRFGRREGATPFMVLLAAWQAVLGRQAGQDELAVGTPIAGRRHVEIEGLIGFFINTLVLRGDLAGDPGFGALVARVREEVLGAHEHQDLPFERLVEELDPERSLSHTPLFQVMFALQNLPLRTMEAGELRWQPVSAGGGTEKFDLSLTLVEEGSMVVGSLGYATDLFDATTMERLAARLGTVLAAGLEAPERPLSALPCQ